MLNKKRGKHLNDAVGSILLAEVYLTLGIDTPTNNDRIVAFVANDVAESTEKDESGIVTFSHEDVMIGFRRFLEHGADNLEETKD